MYLSPSLMLLTFLGLLPHHGLGGHSATTIDSRNYTENSTSDSSLASLRTLLTSISSNSIQLPGKELSCSDLMPANLEHFNTVPRPAQIMIQATLALALQNAGCSQHAETLGLDLYQELGQKDASALLLTMIKVLGTAKSTGENTSFAALEFNLDQLAQKQAWHCRGLVQVNGALLHGQVSHEYKLFPTAAASCHNLGNVCGGVVTNGSEFFQVVLRNGSYFWPQNGSHSWLHQCHRPARMQRSSPKECVNDTEQRVHKVLGFIPGVSPLYNFAASIYYYVQDCIDLAKERAIEGAIDVGFDSLVALSGGAATPFRMGVAMVVKPVFKKGVWSSSASSNMSQWQRIQMLDKIHMNQIDCLYSDDCLPMEVRQYLAYWIEEQSWSQAVELDPSQASYLFHTMLSLLDDQIGGLALGEEKSANMLLKHNLRRSKLHLQSKYQDHPQELAIAIDALLRQERAILSEALAASQASVDPPRNPPVPTAQHKIEERLMEIRKSIQGLKCLIEQHGDLQDNFDFCYRTHSHLENTTPAREPQRTRNINKLQSMLNNLDRFRQEVAAWQVRQRLACIGQKCDTSLGRLEEWFTNSAEILFHLQQLLRMLKGMYEKVTYLRDPLNSRLPPLLKTLQEQIICLLKSAFVVEVQPKMQVPNQRPLVLRTSHKFSVRARLLSLREQKISGAGKGNKGITEGSLSVTEELHIITFTLDYCYEGIKCQLQTSTLPVVIVSNANQISSAWASILWFIMLSTDTKNQLFFSKPPAATWIQLSTVLSWQFSAATERGLDNQQLKMLGEKLCGPGVNSDSTITWDKFSKEATEDNNFSFWTWVDGILLLIQEHLLQLWNHNLIMGFVNRKHEKRLLKKKRAGTFLIRFSESTANGGITFTWVDFNNEGAPQFNSVEPYTRKELESLSLPDIIRDYQLLAKEVIPENPLLYLYPDKPRDEAFCSYYKERREASMTEQRRYLNRRLIRVSTQPGETQTPEAKELLPISNEPVTDELENPEYKVEDLLIAKEDPFLFQSDEEQQPLHEPFNLHEIPQLHVDDPVFQCLLPLENTSTGISGNDIEDLMNLYAKVEV
ncbi:hypothetical protein Chor_012315 [Crotalus horridus]